MIIYSQCSQAGKKIRIRMFVYFLCFQEEAPLGATESGERINGEGQQHTDVSLAEEALGRNISHVM